MTTPTASIAVGKFLDFNPVEILGDEVEGGAATLTVNTNVTRSAVLMNGAASQGDVLLFEFVYWRWIVEGSGLCQWTIIIHNCLGRTEAGATVKLSQSGTLIASGTTNGSGVCVLSVPLGSYDIEIDPAVTGEGTYTQTGVSFATCGQSNTITMTTDGFHECQDCFPCPAMPNSVTLSLDYLPEGTPGVCDGPSTAYSETLTWNGSGDWIGTCYKLSCIRQVWMLDWISGSGACTCQFVSAQLNSGTCSPLHLFPSSNPHNVFIDG